MKKTDGTIISLSWLSHGVGQKLGKSKLWHCVNYVLLTVAELTKILHSNYKIGIFY